MNLLERQTIACPYCLGEGWYADMTDAGEAFQHECPKTIPESMESWNERLLKMCEWLAENDRR